MIFLKQLIVIGSSFRQQGFMRCFRLKHTLTQYLVIFGSLLFFYCLYLAGYNRLLLSASVVLNSSSHYMMAANNNSKSKTEDIISTSIIVKSRLTSASYGIHTETNLLVRQHQSTSSVGTSFNSTCSSAADRRGPHQKVIGYSIYGNNFSQPTFFNLYLKSFKETLKTIPNKYPGWVVRIYHELRSDDAENWRVFNKVLDFGANVSRDHIDLCNATQIIETRKLGHLFEMTWRWLPLLDEMVDTLMSRDSDSVIIPREQDAVREWLASNKTFHIMRDHPLHNSFFVGGCWGVKVSQERTAIVNTAEKMFHENHLHQKGYDQQLLNRFYQSMAVESMVAHDSYCCDQFKGSQPFPTPRQNGWFIGWQLYPNAALKVPCPESCRPHNLTGALAQVDWSFC